MKKSFKKCTSLLLLLALITIIRPVTSIPQSGDSEPGISVCTDDEIPKEAIKTE